MPPTRNMRESIIATIRKIPKGKVSTYGAVAKAAGFPRGARQVVAALRGAVGLPWQRVLGAGGAIKLRGDYAFEQRFRLESEGVTFRGRKVDMKLNEHKFPTSKRNQKVATGPVSGGKSSAGVPRASRPQRE
jgi:methylated-DNA-protein-cysteine methyltransferase related protein